MAHLDAVTDRDIDRFEYVRHIKFKNKGYTWYDPEGEKDEHHEGQWSTLVQQYWIDTDETL